MLCRVIYCEPHTKAQALTAHTHTHTHKQPHLKYYCEEQNRAKARKKDMRTEMLLIWRYTPFVYV